jgi:hypothetical protein
LVPAEPIKGTSPPLTPFPLPGIDTKQLYIEYIFADFPVPGFPIEGLPRFTKKKETF